MNKIQKVNIYGSTGQIGSKSLSIIRRFFPSLKINLLVANQNYKKLIEQANIFNPKFICINDKSRISNLKKNLINKSIEIVDPENLSTFLKSTKSDMSILAISGFQSLNFLPSIFINTKILGIVNKECIVSAGHLFNKLNSKNKTIVFPL